MNAKRTAIIRLLNKTLSQREFWSFCMHMDEEFFTLRPFLKDVANAFQKIDEGSIKSLSISMPPRAGKSYITSMFCAWILGKYPAESVMRNACTATLYAKFSYDVRALVRSEKFNQIFPKVTISDDKGNLMGWNTNYSKQVGYFGAGVGGTIIGFGASKLAITDDLYTGLEAALSDTSNDKILLWKEATHDSRFESGCCRIDIGTRWSINDLIGTSIRNERYDLSIIVPAMTEDNKSFCEAVLTTEEYLDKKHRTEESIWLAEYMQQPVDVKGRLFNNLNTVTQFEFNNVLKANITDAIPKGYSGALGYIDVADQGKDYTAFAIAVIIQEKIYVVDYVFSQANTDVTLPLCSDLINKWSVNYVRVESNNMGAMFARQLQRLNENTKILQIANTSNKGTRILMQSVFIQQSMTFVDNGSKEFNQFVQNLLTYSKEGGNKNDDAPDCLAGLSIFVQSMFRI